MVDVLKEVVLRYLVELSFLNLPHGLFRTGGGGFGLLHLLQSTSLFWKFPGQEVEPHDKLKEHVLEEDPERSLHL